MVIAHSALRRPPESISIETWGGVLVALCALFRRDVCIRENSCSRRQSARLHAFDANGENSHDARGATRTRPRSRCFARDSPGHQCPYCVKQVHDFVDHASDFAATGTRVLLVYPGPPADLDQHAKEFLEKQAELPSNIVLVTDPDYKMTNLYGLRWDAPQETAYPSTFILDKKGMIVFEKISHSHGDRLSAQDALAHLAAN